MKNKIKKYQKTLALIDAANIIYSNRNLKWAIDHEKLIKYLKERFNAVKVIYYAGLEKEDKDKKDFYDKLETFGFETRIKPVAIYPGKFFWKHIQCSKCQQRISKKFQNPPTKKANCDVDLTLDAMKYIPLYDTLLLFSGDNDFSSLADYLKIKGKKTIIFSSIQSCGKKLRKIAHAFIEINQLRQILEFVTK